jgi:hypothetical protein
MIEKCLFVAISCHFGVRNGKIKSEEAKPKTWEAKPKTWEAKPKT